MSVPKQRHTKQRRDRKRKRFKIVSPKSQECPKCKSPKLPHQVCKKCGYYKGKEIINTLKKVEKKKKK
ncbi:MAG: 50S ribosomal protein L32 [Patescibacteria group bacterium]